MTFSRWILLALFTAAAYGADDPPPEILKAEIQELQTVVETLREENRRLDARNRQLMTDVLNLGTRIRELQTELAKSEPPAAADAPPPEPENDLPPAKSTPMGILYVNPTWHYLIINAGSESGIKQGEGGSVLRNGEIIASVKVTDTKPNQSVVEVNLDSLSGGIYPSEKDRVRFP